jgi:TonB family protein
MRTTGATYRKVNRAFRVTRRRTVSPLKTSLSAAQTATPVLALVAVSRDKPRAKSAAGIALVTSLAIHAGAVLAYVSGGTVPHAIPLPGTILVDILTSPQAASPTEINPVVVRAVVPLRRPRKWVWHPAEIQPAQPLRRMVQRVADAPLAMLAALAAPAPKSSPEASTVVVDASMPVRAGAVLPVSPQSPKHAVVADTPTDATAGAEIMRRLRSAAASCYPYAAIRSNLEGITKLRFCTDEKGEPRDIRIVDSSGAQVLDSAAVDCVLPSATPFPATSHLCVTVAVRFELQR